jgi:hypothetical protein
MFNLFFRRYVPGFRVGADGVPGFDIDENGLPRRTAASFDGTLPDSASQQYPGVAPRQISPSMGFGLPGTASWVLPTPLPGFRVGWQGDVPGFNVGPQSGALGFNVDANGDQQQETIWSEELPPGSVTPQDPDTPQTPAPPPDDEDSAPPAPPSFPDWPSQRGPVPPPRPQDPDSPQTPAPPPDDEDSAPPAPPSFPDWSAQRGPVPPPRLPTVFEPRAQIISPLRIAPVTVPGATPSIRSVRPPAGSNFSLANTGNGGGERAQQEMLVPPYQQRQPRMPPALRGTGLPTSRQLETQSPRMAGFEPRSDQEFSQLIEAYRQLKEREDRQPGADRPPLPPNQNGISSSVPGNEGSSLGQRLVQSSIDTLVPGAHYQGLAGQQLGAGNYLGAGVYQLAALLDAALGALTFGLGTELTAVGRAAAAEGVALFRRAFNSEKQLKRYLGPPPKGMQWHHIVEQSQVPQFGQRRIQSIDNVVAIPIEANQALNAFYSSKRNFSEPNRVRVWLRERSFEEQYEFGMERLKQVLGY